MERMTFGEILNDFRTRHDLTIPELSKILGSGGRATEYWLSPTNPKEPRQLAKNAVLATLAAYDKKHKPKAPKPTETAETPAEAM